METMGTLTKWAGGLVALIAVVGLVVAGAEQLPALGASAPVYALAGLMAALGLLLFAAPLARRRGWRGAAVVLNLVAIAALLFGGATHTLKTLPIHPEQPPTETEQQRPEKPAGPAFPARTEDRRRAQTGGRSMLRNHGAYGVNRRKAARRTSEHHASGSELTATGARDAQTDGGVAISGKNNHVRKATPQVPPAPSGPVREKATGEEDAQSHGGVAQSGEGNTYEETALESGRRSVIVATMASVHRIGHNKRKRSRCRRTKRKRCPRHTTSPQTMSKPTPPTTMPLVSQDSGGDQNAQSTDGSVSQSGSHNQLVTNPAYTTSAPSYSTTNGPTTTSTSTSTTTTTNSPTTTVTGEGTCAFGASNWQYGGSGAAVVEGNGTGGDATSGSVHEQNAFPTEYPGEECATAGYSNWQYGGSGAAGVFENTQGGSATSGDVTLVNGGA